MTKSRALVLAACVVICLAIGSAANCAPIPSGKVLYWDGHYLAGTPVQRGFDIFGWDYQTRCTAGGPYINMALGPVGLPPYDGDDSAYFQRLRGEGYILPDASDEEAEDYMNAALPSGYWWGRWLWGKLQWNEALLRNLALG